MKLITQIITRAWVWLPALLVPAIASAQTFTDRIRGGLQGAGQPAGLTESPPLETVIGNIIGVVLGFVGVILLAYLIYAGFLWMTAGGDTDKVKKARQMIFNSIAGLIIITISYAIADFVIEQIITIQTGGRETP